MCVRIVCFRLYIIIIVRHTAQCQVHAPITLYNILYIYVWCGPKEWWPKFRDLKRVEKRGCKRIVI